MNDFRYFYLIKEIRESSNVEQIRLFTLNTEEIANEVISQCTTRLKCLSQILRETVINLLENLRSYTEESELK